MGTLRTAVAVVVVVVVVNMLDSTAAVAAAVVEGWDMDYTDQKCRHRLLPQPGLEHVIPVVVAPLTEANYSGSE